MQNFPYPARRIHEYSVHIFHSFTTEIHHRKIQNNSPLIHLKIHKSSTFKPYLHIKIEFIYKKIATTNLFTVKIHLN